jgi:S-DNA-T family DNA segregation ATPase FtsK/SpoIIIE
MNKKLIEEFKLDIMSLKARVKNLENYILEMPKPEKYVQSTNDLDELFNVALKIIKEYDLVSASLLQRRLASGYSRAARLLDQLEEIGYVGKAEGGKPRQVLKRKDV